MEAVPRPPSAFSLAPAPSKSWSLLPQEPRTLGETARDPSLDPGERGGHQPLLGRAAVKAGRPGTRDLGEVSWGWCQVHPFAEGAQLLLPPASTAQPDLAQRGGCGT